MSVPTVNKRYRKAGQIASTRPQKNHEEQTDSAVEPAGSSDTHSISDNQGTSDSDSSDDSCDSVDSSDIDNEDSGGDDTEELTADNNSVEVGARHAVAALASLDADIDNTGIDSLEAVREKLQNLTASTDGLNLLQVLEDDSDPSTTVATRAAALVNSFTDTLETTSVKASLTWRYLHYSNAFGERPSEKKDWLLRLMDPSGLHKLIVTSQVDQARRSSFLRRITSNWGPDWWSKIPEQMCPLVDKQPIASPEALSKTMLQAISRMSGLVKLDKGIRRMQRAIQARTRPDIRKSNASRQRKSLSLTTVDVKVVIAAIIDAEKNKHAQKTLARGDRPSKRRRTADPANNSAADTVVGASSVDRAVDVQAIEPTDDDQPSTRSLPPTDPPCTDVVAGEHESTANGDAVATDAPTDADVSNTQVTSSNWQPTQCDTALARTWLVETQASLVRLSQGDAVGMTFPPLPDHCTHCVDCRKVMGAVADAVGPHCIDRAV